MNPPIFNKEIKYPHQITDNAKKHGQFIVHKQDRHVLDMACKLVDQGKLQQIPEKSLASWVTYRPATEASF